MHTLQRMTISGKIALLGYLLIPLSFLSYRIYMATGHKQTGPFDGSSTVASYPDSTSLPKYNNSYQSDQGSNVSDNQPAPPQPQDGQTPTPKPPQAAVSHDAQVVSASTHTSDTAAEAPAQSRPKEQATDPTPQDDTPKQEETVKPPASIPDSQPPVNNQENPTPPNNQSNTTPTINI